MSAVRTTVDRVVVEPVSNHSLTERTMLALPASKNQITERVRGEFREMPGLRLTLAQAGRLWSLDTSTCREVLGELVQSGYLCCKSDGAFCRSTDLSGYTNRLLQA